MLLKRLWLFAFLVCSPLFATVYYVSPTGSDGANGTSTGTAWQTISKVNGSSFNPGDSILFQAGGTWREQLVVPSSGSAGSPITFGSYGTGAAPIFMASTNKGSIGDWTAQVGTGQLLVDANTVALYNFNQNLNDSSANSYTLVTRASSPTYTADLWGYSATGNGSWYSSDTTDQAAFNFGTNSFTLEVTFNYSVSSGSIERMANKGSSGSLWYGIDRYANGIRFEYVATGHTISTPYTTQNLFSLGGWHNAALVVDRTANTITGYLDNVIVVGPTSITGWGSADSTNGFFVGAGVAANSPMSSSTNIAQVRVSNIARTSFPSTFAASNPNFWYASGFPTDVGSIFVNGGTVLTGKVSALGSLALQGQFFYDSGNQYVWLYSVGNPATFYPGGIECWYKGSAASVGDIIHVDTKSYLTFQILELKYGGGHGFDCWNCDHVTVQNITTDYLGGSYLTGTTRYGNGIQFLQSATNILIQNNRASQTFDEGISVQTNGDSGNTQNNVTIQGNLVDSCGRGTSFGNVGTGNTATNILYDKNSFTNSGLGWAIPAISNGQGIGALLNVSSSGNTVSNLVFSTNYIENTASGADPIGQGLSFYGGWSIIHNWIGNYGGDAGIRLINNSLPSTISGNIITGPNTSAFGIFASDTSGAIGIYGNVIYATGASGSALVTLGIPYAEGAGHGVTATVKNNLFIQSANVSPQLMYLSSDSTLTLDYNDYYRNTAGNLIQWNDVVYTQAQWANYKAASGQDSHSLTPSDPLFADAALSQFWLQSGSPAIGAGTPLGPPYNIGIQPGSSWPYNVFLTPNVNNDLGAFVYTGSVIDSVTGSGTQASGTTQ